jgi:hypothetical protein
MQKPVKGSFWKLILYIRLGNSFGNVKSNSKSSLCLSLTYRRHIRDGRGGSVITEMKFAYSIA